MRYLLFATLLLTMVTAQAETFGFYPIHYATNEFAQSVGEQLSMDVADAEAGSVSITFMNTGSVGSEMSII